MTLQLGPGTYAGWWMDLPTVEIRHEGRKWWASCPECPGWSAAASSFERLVRLISEHHGSPEATHRGWIAYSMPFVDTTRTLA